MWIRQVFLGFAGLCSGLAAAGGMFALLIALGIISRMAGRTHTARYIRWYEDAAALGGILGNLFSIYAFPVPAGVAGLIVFGLSAGIYTGAWSMALTEIVDVIPIFSRRIGLKTGICWLILSMAAGRAFGALIFYIFRF